MNLNKKSISKKISSDVSISQLEALNFINSFIELIKKSSKRKDVKISGFGTFFMHESPRRVGRNPKTKESYIIKPRNKLNFKGSNIIKKILNPWKSYYFFYI